jgi:hypothetical protein
MIFSIPELGEQRSLAVDVASACRTRTCRSSAPSRQGGRQDGSSQPDDNLDISVTATTLARLPLRRTSPIATFAAK